MLGDYQKVQSSTFRQDSMEWAVLQRQELLRTLIIYSRVNFKPSDLFGHFSSLRVLHISFAADCDRLVSSISKLKHLRYLYLGVTNVSKLPVNIHKMKFLQYIDIIDCQKLRHLPLTTIKLMHLRSLDITGSVNIRAVPKGIGGLTNLRIFQGFPVHVDMDAGNAWCSLQELAHLSQLRKLTKYGLEKVSASWMAEKATISTKGHLNYLDLYYNSTAEHTAGPRGEAEQQQQQSVMEEVFEKLYPPTCLENLGIQGGYIGRRLPKWMSAPASSAGFNSLFLFSLSFVSGRPSHDTCVLHVVGIDELKHTGMEILKKCDGLPLTIKVVGGLLSTRYPSEHEGKVVLTKLAWPLDGRPPELDSRLYLSYEDMTPQLGQCFLYCSLIPKGQEIIQDVVTNMWVSEGFIQCPAAGSPHEYGLEERATEYYNELIKRNLIEPKKNIL
ncbi:hypothetical protein U9M48_000277 [Paspalum notatum var. saurae]|uniref:NB-ARC domain-containing protein n=1 Tax=Paspalum notatum var. saurae TaxID=547442 RepID=A0AAQ3PF33_PASNO